MNTCKTCKHWLNPPPDDEPGPNRDDTGRCLASVHWGSYDTDNDTEEARKAEMLVMDGSDYFAALFTTAEHGCTSWEAKGE